MEFDINVNFLFKDILTKVDCQFQPCRRPGCNFQIMRKELFQVIDKMGESSAKAQGLYGPITTGRKIELSDHHLYIMTDPEGNKGSGSVIGILKVGHKKLFVYDRHGQQWEMNPLCVLDFYVHESRQRRGCGHHLFGFMLKNENVVPQHLAIDRPSSKFLSFLSKHYGLSHEIPQVNNFVIFEGFFTNRTDLDYQKFHHYGNTIRPADYPVRNPGKPEQSRQQGDNIVDKFHRAHTGLPSSNSLPPSGHAIRIRSSGSVRSQQQNAAISHKDLPVRPRSRQTPSQLGSPEDGLTDQSLHTTATGIGSQNMPLHTAMYSRYQMKTPSEQFPSVHSQQRATNCVQQQLGGASTAEDGSSQILQRDRPPTDYSNAFYRQQLYQGRDGHLLVPSDPRVGKTQTAAINLATREPNVTVPGKVQQKPTIYPGSYYNNPSLVGINNTSWTVMGVLRNQHLQNARQYGHSRLW